MNNNMISIVMVKNELQDLDEFYKCIHNLKNVTISAHTNDSQDAISLIKQHSPTAVIMDIELSNGGGCGLDILEWLRDNPTVKRPYIMITTSSNSETTKRRARSLGADYIISKSQNRYSAKEVLRILFAELEFFKNEDTVLQSANKCPKKNQESDNTTEEKDNTIKVPKEIYNILTEAGVSHKLNGYKFIAEAITLFKSGEHSNIIVKLAKLHSKSPSAIQSSVDYAIKKAWYFNTSDPSDKLYPIPVPPNRDTPTFLEFVSYFANYV